MAIFQLEEIADEGSAFDMIDQLESTIGFMRDKLIKTKEVLGGK